MIKIFYLTIFNNYVSLVLEGALYQYKRQLIAGFIAYLALLTICLATRQFLVFSLLDAVLKLFLAYFTFLAFTMLYWRYRTKKLGLSSLLVYPGSSFWLNKLLARKNIKVPVFDNTIELHVNIRRSYKDWDEYNSVFDQDIKKLVSYIKSGQFGKNVTITFNSFNRQITDKLEKALSEHGRCIRFKQVALPNITAKVYHPAHFRKVQIRMFGEVKSTRSVHTPAAWELLIYNT